MENITLDRCCIHTITTKPWSLPQAVENYAAMGIKGISVWQNATEGIGPHRAGEIIREAGLEIVSYVRGGFFTHTGSAGRAQAIENNKKLLEEAAALGASMLVLVCGASPGQSLETSRQQIKEGITAILPLAEKLKVKLAIEPLHPMYAADRSAINTLAQANDMAEHFNSPFVGIAVDVYHLWWDGNLEGEIARCGANGNLFAYHVCDWKVNTIDMLNDRGLMGEGCINLKQIRSWVENTGFKGFCEVEIFSNIHWAKDQHLFLEEVVEAFVSKV
ncbi:sugar phosphate isomerase/epimerase family protein [Dyadobacter sediminis]|uniref:Sugar phosphate isomerase/epimerase n=1 Tax=Dyadobacter sediminis TaxID=1493691 RepID=A0A5R9KA25_9BACT|nr:sugar phosphate isomerase/epimerase family protein [Dyadobacter sediminis]TLU91622.1 sugar phosphate isomerase/epimerase [Dyadobacter sediminis]GGC01810.1 xylose isomerase [Dyadobacter sediminis]